MKTNKKYLRLYVRNKNIRASFFADGAVNNEQIEQKILCLTTNKGTALLIKIKRILTLGEGIFKK